MHCRYAKLTGYISPPQRLPRGEEVGERLEWGTTVRYVISSQHSRKLSLFPLPTPELVSLYGQSITKEASVIQVLYQDYTRDKIFNNCIVFCLFVNSPLVGIHILKS